MGNFAISQVRTARPGIPGSYPESRTRSDPLRPWVMRAGTVRPVVDVMCCRVSITAAWCRPAHLAADK